MGRFRDPSDFSEETGFLVGWCEKESAPLKFETNTYGNACYQRTLFYQYRRMAERLMRDRDFPPERRTLYRKKFEAMGQWTLRAYTPEGWLNAPKGYDYTNGPGTVELIMKGKTESKAGIYKRMVEAAERVKKEERERKGDSANSASPINLVEGRSDTEEEIRRAEQSVVDMFTNQPRSPTPNVDIPKPKAWMVGIEDDCEHDYEDIGEPQEVYPGGPVGQERRCRKCGDRRLVVPD